MGAQHTPGPWWATTGGTGWEVRTYRDGENPETSPYIGEYYGASITHGIGDHTEARTRGNEEANARLIAAAPDLLEALEKASNTLAGLGYPKIADNMCAPAIAKARGTV